MSSKSDYIVIVDAGQACICNQYGGVRNRVGEYGAMCRRICPGFNVAGAYFSGNNRIVINKVGGGGGIFNYDGGLNASF